MTNEPILRKTDSFEKAALLMLLTRIIIKSLSIISTLILVRLILPEDFGLVAIALSIYGFVEIFGQFGFHNALVQKGNPSEDDYHTVFTFGLLFGMCAAIITAVCAPFAAIIYDDARIQETLLLVSTVFLINGVKNVKTVKFQIDMDFKRELYFQVAPKVICFFATILMAYLLRDYKALVLGMILNSIITAFLSYQMVPYKPKIKLLGATSLWAYSKWLMLNSIVQYFNNRAVDLIVGKMISVKAVGLYSISTELSFLPLTDISGPINKASFAAYSKEKSNLLEVKEIYEKNTAMTAILAIPISAGLFVTAEYLVPVALGQSWVQAIELIKIMSISCIILAVSANSGYVLMALGYSKINFMTSLFRTVSFLTLLFILTPYVGLLGAAWSGLLATIIYSWLSLLILKRYSGIGFFSAIRVVWRPILASTTMVVSVLFAQKALQLKPLFFDLTIQIFLGVIIYVSSIFLYWIISGKNKGIEKDILENIFSRINKKTRR